MGGKIYFIKNQRTFFYSTGMGGTCGDLNPNQFRDITLSSNWPIQVNMKDSSDWWYDRASTWEVVYGTGIPCLQYSTTTVMFHSLNYLDTYLDVCSSGSCNGSSVNGNFNIRGAQKFINPTTCAMGPNCNISTWIVEGARPSGQCVLEGDLIYLRNREKNMLLTIGCSGTTLQISPTQATQFYITSDPGIESGIISAPAPPPGPAASAVSGGSPPPPPPPPTAPTGPFYRLVARQTWSGTTSAFTSSSWSLNANDPSNSNYAILDKLNLYKLTTGPNAGKWQFKLVYPSLQKDGAEQEWIQSSNPVTSATVTGYTPIRTFSTDNCWGGLHTHPTNALLVGSINSSPCNGYSWYAVGLYVPFTQNGVTGLPAANTIVSSVYLYVWDDTVVPPLGTCSYPDSNGRNWDLSFLSTAQGTAVGGIYSLSLCQNSNPPISQCPAGYVGYQYSGSQCFALGQASQGTHSFITNPYSSSAPGHRFIYPGGAYDVCCGNRSVQIDVFPCASTNALTFVNEQPTLKYNFQWQTTGGCPAPVTPTSPTTPTGPTTSSGANLGTCNRIWCSSKDKTCTNTSSCCSGICTNSYCSCALSGQSCSEDRNCCAGQCSGGYCVSGYGGTQPCTQDNQCSSRNCIAGTCDSDRVNALVSCPAGTTVLAGGGKCSSGSSLLKSAPYTDGKDNKWNVICSSNYAFDAYALCC